MTTAADAIARERAARRAVIRWRALYSRMRPRMREMDRRASERLHRQLKDAEHAAIDAHYWAMCRLKQAAEAEGIVFLADAMRERDDILERIDATVEQAAEPITLTADERRFLLRIFTRSERGDDALLMSAVRAFVCCPTHHSPALRAFFAGFIRHSQEQAAERDEREQAS